MRKKNVITMIGMIVMIIGVFVLFNGQLSAEEEVGRSIFPRIETPHPYTAASEGKALVWTTTIDQPGAAWIKIHFSRFRLNQGDYVDLVDMNGSLIERIKGKNVARKAHSKFKIKSDINKKASFWGPAIDGNKVIVELHCVSDKQNGWGLTIDEIGLGDKPIKPIFDKSSSTVDKNSCTVDNLEKGSEMSSCCCKNKKASMCGSRKTDSTGGRIGGMMLYKKEATWYTCKGYLVSNSGDHFFPDEPAIVSQDIVDTLEVRLFFNYTKYSKVNNFPGYYTYYGDSFIDDDSNNDISHLTLLNNNRVNGLAYKTEIPNVKMPEIYATVLDYCVPCTCSPCTCTVAVAK